MFLTALILSFAADLIFLKSGKTMAGEVLEEQDTQVKIRLRKNAVWIPRVDIDHIETTAQLREQYRGRSAKAASAADHRTLALWCRERSLAEEEAAEWTAVAAADPANEEAHKALGHVLADGRWMTAEEARKALGLVDRDGEEVTPLRAKILDLLDSVASEDLVARGEAKLAIKKLDDAGRAELEKITEESRARLEAAVAKPGSVLSVLQDRARPLSGLLVDLVTDERQFPSKGASDATLRQMRGWVSDLDRIGTDPAGAFFGGDPKLSRDAERLSRADLALGNEDRAAALRGAFLKNVGAEAVFRAGDLFKALRTKVDDINKSVEMSEAERGLLDALNTYRLRCGRGPLRWNDKLAACARQHSEEMKKLDYFAHVSPVAKYATMTKRIGVAGFKSKWAGENLARGDDPPAVILQALQDSPGHHRNLLFADYTRVGIAKEGEFWTMNFGGDPEE
ncbi:MAG: hypothetical protein K8T20_02025 [Planctomycetes bacterium]|nr:hypothetical protein [Planctomycetota bacterium]